MQPDPSHPKDVYPPQSTPDNPPPHRIIQPISSEQDILDEVQATQPANHQSPDATTPMPSGSTVSSGLDFDDYSTSTLVTEPLTQQSPLKSSDNATPTGLQSKKPKASIKKKLGLIIVTIIVGILGVSLWVYFSGKIAMGDLVSETVGQSSFLRPKQWKALTVPSSGVAYGDASASDGKSTGMITFKESPQSYLLQVQNESALSSLRTQLLNSFSDQVLAQMSQGNGSGCSGDTADIDKQADTTKNATTVGLVKVSLSCKKGSGTIMMKIRVVAGLHDGRVRTIGIGGTELNWMKNETVFQSMLDSISEASSAQEQSA